MARSADSTTTRTARRKTSLPSMNRVPPCSHLSKCLSEPSEFMFQLSKAPGPSTGSTTTAPAPSPTMMAILRSSMSVIFEQGLGAHEQHRPGAHGDQAGHGDQPVDEARARCVEVEGAALHADPVLHRRRGARDDAVGRGGGQHQVVDLLGRATGLGQRSLRGFDGQARRRAADVALTDAGALDDPLVARVERERHVVVGHHLVRDGDAPAGDADPSHAADPARIPWMQTIPASP